MVHQLYTTFKEIFHDTNTLWTEAFFDLLLLTVSYWVHDYPASRSNRLHASLGIQLFLKIGSFIPSSTGTILINVKKTPADVFYFVILQDQNVTSAGFFSCAVGRTVDQCERFVVLVHSMDEQSRESIFDNFYYLLFHYFPVDKNTPRFPLSLQLLHTPSSHCPLYPLDICDAQYALMHTRRWWYRQLFKKRFLLSFFNPTFERQKKSKSNHYLGVFYFPVNNYPF